MLTRRQNVKSLCSIEAKKQIPSLRRNRKGRIYYCWLILTIHFKLDFSNFFIICFLPMSYTSGNVSGICLSYCAVNFLLDWLCMKWKLEDQSAVSLDFINSVLNIAPICAVLRLNWCLLRKRMRDTSKKSDPPNLPYMAHLLYLSVYIFLLWLYLLIIFKWNNNLYSTEIFF